MSASKEPVENAVEVIERFGGIRPMAKKMDVAVTTVQGWKKRDVIPGARRQSVISAAKEHEIDLSDLMSDAAPANENDGVVESPSDTVEGEPQVETVVKKEDIDPIAAPTNNADQDAVSKSIVITLILVILALGAVILLFWPEDKKEAKMGAENVNVSAIGGEAASEGDKQSFFGAMIPENLNKQIDSIKVQANEAQKQIGHVVDKAKEVSADVLADDAGTVAERFQKLEKHAAEIAEVPAIADFFSQFNSLNLGQSINNQAEIDKALAVIAGVLDEQYANLGLNSKEPAANDVEEQIRLYNEIDEQGLIETARQDNKSVNNVFAGVPSEDLKAAALLLGMSQFRSSLNRNNKPFADDLNVLKSLIGQDNPALVDALEKLAPQAEKGVLTPSGLSQEFKTIAGDAVVASLTGDDVSLEERTNARINEVFQLEKDGELITGTETQSKLNETQKKLDEGNILGAILSAESIDGEAGKVLQPWLNRAKATLHAQGLDSLLTEIVGTGTVSQDSNILNKVEEQIRVIQPSEFVHDDASGYSIYIPAETAPVNSGNL